MSPGARLAEARAYESCGMPLHVRLAQNALRHDTNATLWHSEAQVAGRVLALAGALGAVRTGATPRAGCSKPERVDVRSARLSTGNRQDAGRTSKRRALALGASQVYTWRAPHRRTSARTQHRALLHARGNYSAPWACSAKLDESWRPQQSPSTRSTACRCSEMQARATSHDALRTIPTQIIAQKMRQCSWPSLFSCGLHAPRPHLRLAKCLTTIDRLSIPAAGWRRPQVTRAPPPPLACSHEGPRSRARRASLRAEAEPRWSAAAQHPSHAKRPEATNVAVQPLKRGAF